MTLFAYIETISNILHEPKLLCAAYVYGKPTLVDVGQAAQIDIHFVHLYAPVGILHFCGADNGHVFVLSEAADNPNFLMVFLIDKIAFDRPDDHVGDWIDMHSLKFKRVRRDQVCMLKDVPNRAKGRPRAAYGPLNATDTAGITLVLNSGIVTLSYSCRKVHRRYVNTILALGTGLPAADFDDLGAFHAQSSIAIADASVPRGGEDESVRHERIEENLFEKVVSTKTKVYDGLVNHVQVTASALGSDEQELQRRLSTIATHAQLEKGHLNCDVRIEVLASLIPAPPHLNHNERIAWKIDRVAGAKTKTMQDVNEFSPSGPKFKELHKKFLDATSGTGARKQARRQLFTEGKECKVSDKMSGYQFHEFDFDAAAADHEFA